MATINLLALEPHKVSRDLSGYITYIYGAAKTGKTTLATRAGGSLLLAFERGYNALPGVIAQDITSWTDMRAVLRELKKPEVREKFKSVIVDTVDIAGSFCEKYICTQNDVDKIGDIPYGGGWNLMKKEFEDVFRTITQLGFAVFFISHDKDKVFKTEEGFEYNQVVPSCPTSFNNIAKDMSDIYAYAKKYQENGVAKVKLILRSKDNSVDTGCRFKYIAPEIPMSYEALVDALNKAIDEEAKEYDNAFVTDERNVDVVKKELNYDELIKEFNSITAELMNKDAETFGPRIVYIVEKYLGKGKKVAESSIAQVELIDLIVSEIKDDLLK